jgi:GTP-binding protein
MKVKSAQFHSSCTKEGQFPDFSFPEFAFLGRSNVGKSSLINMITGKRDLTKTGSRPGVTRAVNFFIINGNITLADLPGYGYAKLPRDVSAAFIPLMRDYIRCRERLRFAFLLIDIRRVPDEKDRAILSLLLERGVPVAAVITKSDKLSKNRRARQSKVICRALGIDESSLLFSSSHTGEGKDLILDLIEEYRKV